MLNKDKNIKIENGLATAKLGSFVLLGIVFMQNYLGPSTDIFTETQYAFNFFVAMLSTILVSGAYYYWSFVLIRKINPAKVHLARIIESLIIFGFYMAVILVTGRHLSNYKIIFLFIIIPVTIQFGLHYGLAAAGLSSLYILIVDLLSVSSQTVNQFFEDDLMLSAIFFLAAWFLGYYVRLEQDHNKMLEDRGNIDGLTGLYNHRYFHDELQRLMAEGQDVSLIFMDIDFFKEYNDMYGHLSGDNVLALIGGLLSKTITEDAIVTRYGGDEFAAIFTDLREDQLFVISERVRKVIQEASFEGQEYLSSKNLTISLGIAPPRDDISDHLELIKCADDALYRAKFFNKNRVEVYSSILDNIKLDIEEEHIDLITSIKTLISVINAKDRYTYGHVERVVMFARMLADELRLSKKDKNTLIYGAYMHDIGKISISQQILNKKRPLTDGEWHVVHQHPANGVDIIKHVESLSDIAPLIMHHHEKYDGKGYPSALKGKQIPYLARVLTVVDSFDAMTFNRPYKSALTFVEAAEELERCSGTQFDPEITRAFLKIVRDILKNPSGHVASKHYGHLFEASNS